MPAIELNDKNFNTEVLNSDVPVLVDFWAPWCGPCQTMLPTVEDLSKDYKNGEVKICKLNIDENKIVPSQYNVMSIPMFVIFHKGQLVDQLIGIQSKEHLKERIGQVLENG